MTNTSLHKFCKDNGIPKTSVYDRCKLLDIPTRDGLSPEDQKVLLREFDIEPTEPAATPAPAAAMTIHAGNQGPVPAPTEPEAPAAGGMTVFTGNHCTTLSVPGFDGLTVDLGQFRDSSAMVIADPLAAAEQFLAAADMIQGALGADIAEREQRLARTKQAQAQVATKAQQLALEQRLYRLQAAQLDAATSDETSALADALAQLQSLGKPASADDAPDA